MERFPNPLDKKIADHLSELSNNSDAAAAAAASAAAAATDASAQLTNVAGTISDASESISGVNIAVTALMKSGLVGRLEKQLGFRPRMMFFGADTSGNAVVNLYRDHETSPAYVGNANETFLGLSSYNGNLEFFSSYAHRGYSSGGFSSNSQSPQSGYMGTATCAEYTTCGNIDIDDDGLKFPYYSNIGRAISNTGVVIGEDESYRNGLMLVAYNNHVIPLWPSDIRDSLITTTSVYRTFDLTSLVGMNITGHYNWTNFGGIAYNRKTKTLAMMFCLAQGSSYRLHIFKLSDHPRPGEPAHLGALLQAAIDGGSATYSTVDCAWGVNSDNEGSYRTVIVPCDDDTFWLVKKQTSSSLKLARVTGVPGSRSFSNVTTISMTTSYGIDQGNMYATRGIVSADQSAVCVFSWYYYYGCGINAYFLNRKTASNGYYTYSNTDSGYGFSIAPCGGANFAMRYMTNLDNFYGTNTFLCDLAGLETAGSGLSVLSNVFEAHTYSTSTNYNAGLFIHLKRGRQFTTEWDEKLAREAEAA